MGASTLGTVFAQKQALNTTEANIERILQIHYLKPHMKSPYDTIKVEGSTAKISVWRDLPTEPNLEKLECQAYQWILTGRGAKLGEGAAIVFQNLPGLSQIELELVELEFKIEKLDRRGKLKKVAVRKPIIKTIAERSKVSRSKTAHAPNLRNVMMKNSDSCLKIGRSLLARKD